MTTQNMIGRAYSTTPTATTIASWDANSNLSANNQLIGYATTATAAGTTTLTVSSPYQQFFTGVTTQTVVMPVTSTLVLGQQWYIVNNSSGVVTVQSSGANTIIAMAANTVARITCILTSGTTAASWFAEYDQSSLTLPLSPSNGGTGVANSGNLTWGGAVTFSGAFTTAFTVTGNTSVTLPTSGTLATTAQLNFPTWNDVSGTSQAATINNGYIISNAAQTTVTLPATAAEGSVIAVRGKGAAGWILTANTGQTIKLGNATTSSAGSLTSTNQWDGITVVCVTADTTWAAHSVIGNLTVT